MLVAYFFGPPCTAGYFYYSSVYCIEKYSFRLLAPPSSHMNPPLRVIKMVHITIIRFYVNFLYIQLSCMYANKSYLTDVHLQGSIYTHKFKILENTPAQPVIYSLAPNSGQNRSTF